MQTCVSKGKAQKGQREERIFETHLRLVAKIAETHVQASNVSRRLRDPNDGEV